MKIRSLAFGALALPCAALAGPTGDPADMYFLSDAHSEIYQFERVSPWNYVPGTYAGGAMSMVFSNNVQLQNNASYLGCVAGSSNNFFVGGFNSLVKVDSSTGAYIGTIAPGIRIGPSEAPNGNVAVGGSTGMEEYDSNTGLFVRTINSYGDGYNLSCFSGNKMYVSNWAGSNIIKQFDFVTGSPNGPDINVPFVPQEIAIGPDGGLYASALYESPTYEGIYRYNGSAWSLFADTSSQSGTGPHGFAWDPVNNELYLAMQTGEIFRFDGFTGAYLNQPGAIPTKLTDVLFHEVVPAPGAMALLGLGALALSRRRR